MLKRYPPLSFSLFFVPGLMTRCMQWARHFVDSEVLDIENVTEALNRTNYGTCVYEGDNDVVDHQIVNIEYEGGITASVTMSACMTIQLDLCLALLTKFTVTESVCQRGTRIQGTKGELIGDMTTFVSFIFRYILHEC